MILLSFLIKKFEFIRPLLHDMRVLLHYTNSKVTDEKIDDKSKAQGEDQRQSLANIQIYLKNLKEIANNLLSVAEKKNNPDNSENGDGESDANDGFMRNFRTEDKRDEETKKKDDDAARQADEIRRKMEVFMILWLRQIVIYNTHYVLHLAVTNSNLSSILDVRPSIVKATSIKYALVSLMNPRMQSLQQVNNFKSMKRILDNNVTYFFQNFISTKERALI